LLDLKKKKKKLGDEHIRIPNVHNTLTKKQGGLNVQVGWIERGQ